MLISWHGKQARPDESRARERLRSYVVSDPDQSEDHCCRHAIPRITVYDYKKMFCPTTSEIAFFQ